MKKKNIFIIVLIVLFIILTITTCILYEYNIIPHRKYTNEHFNIQPYKSEIDKDNDGIDDQTDILFNVREYIKTKPIYESKYYGTGYPDDNFGTCVDIIGFGLKNAGYDIMTLLNKHVLENRDLYDIDIVDKNIDFRRVENLKIFFDYNAISLTTDINEIEKWQGGDIVVFKTHIAIISDKRNKKGIPFIIHHGSKSQLHYEEDLLKHMEKDIIGHYRIS